VGIVLEAKGCAVILHSGIAVQSANAINAANVGGSQRSRVRHVWCVSSRICSAIGVGPKIVVNVRFMAVYRENTLVARTLWVFSCLGDGQNPMAMIVYIEIESFYESVG
jgi:hypothetical protein